MRRSRCAQRTLLLLLQQVLVHRGQKLCGCQPADKTIGTKHPPDRTPTINQERGRPGDVFLVGSGAGMDDLEGGTQTSFWIGDDGQMRKVSLGHLGIRLIVHRSHDDPRAALGKFRILRFELPELDLADQSPPPAEKDQGRRWSVF